MISSSVPNIMAFLFITVSTTVLAFAAMSFDYFCRWHFERQDEQVLQHKIQALKAVLTRNDRFESSMASNTDRFPYISFGFTVVKEFGPCVYLTKL